jgi:hypothetical protein
VVVVWGGRGRKERRKGRERETRGSRLCGSVAGRRRRRSVGLVCTSLDQLLVNVLLGRVFTILRQFDYAFLLRRTVGYLFF